MDNKKTPKYYIGKIMCDIEFCINHLQKETIESFNEDEILSSAITLNLFKYQKM